MTKPRAIPPRRTLAANLAALPLLILILGLAALGRSHRNLQDSGHPEVTSTEFVKKGSSWQEGLTQISRILRQPIIADVETEVTHPLTHADTDSVDEMLDALGLEDISDPGDAITVLTPRPNWQKQLDECPPQLDSKYLEKIRMSAQRLGEAVHRPDYAETEQDRALITDMARASLRQRVSIRRASLEPKNIANTQVCIAISQKSGEPSSVTFQFPTGQMAMWPLLRARTVRQTQAFIQEPLLMTASQAANMASRALQREVSIATPFIDRYIWVTPVSRMTAPHIPQALARLLNRRVREKGGSIVLVDPRVGRVRQPQRRIAHFHACRQTKRAFAEIPPQLVEMNFKRGQFLRIEQLPAQAQKHLREALLAKFAAECASDIALIRADLSSGKLVVPQDRRNTPYLLVNGVSVKLLGMRGREEKGVKPRANLRSP